MESILRTIFNAKVKTVKIAPTICKCSNCKKEIDINDLYLRFAGELLHTDCLVGYMQKLNILDVVIQQKTGDKNR